MFAKFCVVLCLLWVCNGLQMIQMDGSYDMPIKQSINSSVQYIIKFSGVLDTRPPVVQLYSAAAESANPIMVVVRQPKEVLSWQVPLDVDTENGIAYYFNTSRTLCYDEIALIGDGLQNLTEKDNPIITMSTSSEKSVDFELLLKHRTEFLVQPRVVYNLEITPGISMFYFYNFLTNHSNPEQNFDTVFLEVQSDDSVCMVVSIQNASCIILDLNHDVTSSGLYETVSQKGAITIPKGKFPKGFYIVFVAKGSDYDCTRSLESVPDRKKTFWFRITPNISYRQYANAVIYTLMSFATFCIVFGVSFCFCPRRGAKPRTMEHVDSAPIDPMDTSIAADETDNDTTVNSHFDREIFLNKPVIYLSDLARKDPKVLIRKAYLYLYNVITVAVFYGLPVVQLVFIYQYVVNESGQQDLCYYNFWCAHPLGVFSDFNHIFSNVGYLVLGILFLTIVRKRETLHKDLEFDRQYGIPQHFGLFYAMGVALSMEGVLSACYHICPCQSNFQFDASFMYVMAILCMVTLYENRHPDINAHAYATFLVLAVVILLGMIGLFHPNIYFLSVFTAIHLLCCLYVTLQVYYMGCWKLGKSWMVQVYHFLRYDIRSSFWSFLRPKYLNRMVFLIIANVINWCLAFFGLYTDMKNFAFFVLLLFMTNTLLYMGFYICMKVVYKERVNLLSVLFGTLALVLAVFAMYFFVNKSISWTQAPAQSRHFNQGCVLLDFYDNHDVWHFLSALGMFFMFMMLLTVDDDLSHTHRSRIHVF